MLIRHVSIDWFEQNKLSCVSSGCGILFIAPGCNSEEVTVQTVKNNNFGRGLLQEIHSSALLY